MAGIIFLVFILIFLAMLYQLFSVVESKPSQHPSLQQRTTPTEHKPALRFSQNAIQAAARAGYRSDPRYVQLTDLGLLAYRDLDDPRLVRTGDISTDTRFLRPFVELWVPYEAHGSIRLELLDQDSRLRYADDARYELLRGRNTILPDTWLPLEGKNIEPSQWTLRVAASDTLLGVHEFGWRFADEAPLRRYIESDGELSPELAEALQEQQSRAISLSELLDDG